MKTLNQLKYWKQIKSVLLVISSIIVVFLLPIIGITLLILVSLGILPTMSELKDEYNKAYKR